MTVHIGSFDGNEFGTFTTTNATATANVNTTYVFTASSAVPTNTILTFPLTINTTAPATGYVWNYKFGGEDEDS